MSCQRCQKREKDHPWNKPVEIAPGFTQVMANPPGCAFTAEGVFTRENWNCATMNSLRVLEGYDPDPYKQGNVSQLYDDDQTCRVIRSLDGQFLILGWYKMRGKVESAGWLDEHNLKPLTLADAEKVLAAYGVP